MRRYGQCTYTLPTSQNTRGASPQAFRHTILLTCPRYLVIKHGDAEADYSLSVSWWISDFLSDCFRACSNHRSPQALSARYNPTHLVPYTWRRVHACIRVWTGARIHWQNLSPILSSCFNSLRRLSRKSLVGVSQVSRMLPMSSLLDM